MSMAAELFETAGHAAAVLPAPKGGGGSVERVDSRMVIGFLSVGESSILGRHRLTNPRLRRLPGGRAAECESVRPNEMIRWQPICLHTSVVFSLKQLAALFKALSEATRLRIINLLYAQSLWVGDLQEVLGVPQPEVSRQLSILRQAKLVLGRRYGPRVSYSLARSPFLNYPLSNFLKEVRPFFPELEADARKVAELKGDSRFK